MTAALVGAGIGIVTQAHWLADPSPQLNWTLPKPHHFTAAGWYHAVFLVVMTSTFTGLWGTVLARGAAVDRLSSRPKTAVAAAAAASVGFAALVILDSSPSRHTQATKGTFGAIGLGAAVMGASIAAALIARHRKGNSSAPHS
jgi:hypothetical protein